MRTDGQMYKPDSDIHAPPCPAQPPEPAVCVPDRKKATDRDTLIILALILIIMQDKKDMPLTLALAYILLA